MSSINKSLFVEASEKKIIDDSNITSIGVTKLIQILAGVGVGESHSNRAFQKQKIGSCRNHFG